MGIENMPSSYRGLHFRGSHIVALTHTFIMLTLPGSLVGKSPDLNAEPHNFFYFTYILSGSYSHPYFRQFFYLGTSKIYKKCLINFVGVPTAGVSRSIDIKPGYVG